MLACEGCVCPPSCCWCLRVVLGFCVSALSVLLVRGMETAGTGVAVVAISPQQMPLLFCRGIICISPCLLSRRVAMEEVKARCRTSALRR